MFAHSDRNRPPAKCEIRGVACHDEPRAAGEARLPRRGARDARRNLQLVHRGLRDRRPERGQGAARRTKRIADSVRPRPISFASAKDLDSGPWSEPLFPHPAKSHLQAGRSDRVVRPDGCGRDLFCRVATGVCSITDDEPEREAREAAVQSHKQAPSVRWEFFLCQPRYFQGR